MNQIKYNQNVYEIGQTIFKQLFELNDTDLKEKLISITDGEHKGILTTNCDCVRTIRNSEPEKIEYHFYDTLIIDWKGVTFKPEYGSENVIIKFNDHFKI